MEAETITFKILIWGLGISVTGFFFLAMWIRQVSDRTISKDLQEIKMALIGDLERPGIITILHQQQRDLDFIKIRCDKNHGT